MQVEQALMLEWYVSQVLDISSLSTQNWSPGCRDLRFLAKSKSCWYIQKYLACHRHSNRSPLSYKNQRCDGGKAGKSKPQTPERDIVWVLESIPLSFSVEKREDRWVCQICLLPHLDFAACLLRRGLRQSRGFVTWEWEVWWFNSISCSSGFCSPILDRIHNIETIPLLCLHLILKKNK